MGNKHICLPFASEAQYREYVDDPAEDRQYLSEMLSQYPELFPNGMDQGFTFHDAYASVKQDLIMRRIKLITTGAVFTLRPSFVMPYMIARTDEVEKALYLRHGGCRLTPWPTSLAAMPCSGIVPGWPLAARRLSAPRSKSHRRGRAIWWPMRS